MSTCIWCLLLLASSVIVYSVNQLYASSSSSSSSLLSFLFQSDPSTFDKHIGISPKIMLQLEWTHYVMMMVYIIMILDVIPLDTFFKVIVNNNNNSNKKGDI
ncbi:uncharacterized protein BX664DRAFT_333841 [Halteromyces radiatus]|uniref:uncharacterized protein n=1 Tax=Halteromyces radiatus TaxID=101107 RepID=UPI002220CF43|nr:uncharacterized protein BX664DRAFT_333841 [Halteromyces radiatus]KAI8089766.1 hypothetical protein BX664DRAFT_333841 [Halteromyces radiatus]